MTKYPKVRPRVLLRPLQFINVRSRILFRVFIVREDQSETVRYGHSGQEAQPKGSLPKTAWTQAVL